MGPHAPHPTRTTVVDCPVRPQPGPPVPVPCSPRLLTTTPSDSRSEITYATQRPAGSKDQTELAISVHIGLISPTPFSRNCTLIMTKP